VDKNLDKLRALIRQHLLKEGGYYLSQQGDVVQDPGHRYFTQDEPFKSNTKDLNLPMVRYYLDELPPLANKILHAPDAKILDEPDLPEGIYAIHSKMLGQSFSFSYGNEDADDWTVFLN
jgi:hypothetical protein